MKANKIKIVAWIILILVYVFPFRYAFLSGLYPGKYSMLNFLTVITGYIVFLFLIDHSHKKKL